MSFVWISRQPGCFDFDFPFWILGWVTCSRLVVGVAFESRLSFTTGAAGVSLSDFLARKCPKLGDFSSREREIQLTGPSGELTGNTWI
jgi:hypothetical protein